MLLSKYFSFQSVYPCTSYWSQSLEPIYTWGHEKVVTVLSKWDCPRPFKTSLCFKNNLHILQPLAKKKGSKKWSWWEKIGERFVNYIGFKGKWQEVASAEFSEKLHNRKHAVKMQYLKQTNNPPKNALKQTPNKKTEPTNKSTDEDP